MPALLSFKKPEKFSLFLLFRETSEISRNNFFVSLCFVFREKKGCEMETLVRTQHFSQNLNLYSGNTLSQTFVQ
jgi:hypothetical protein